MRWRESGASRNARSVRPTGVERADAVTIRIPVEGVESRREAARWLRTVAGGADETLAARAWVTSLLALQARHLDAPAQPVTEGSAATVRALVDSLHDRRGPFPVGSEDWLRLLGEGGIEDLGGLLV